MVHHILIPCRSVRPWHGVEFLNINHESEHTMASSPEQIVPAYAVNPHIDQMLWDVFVTALEGGINDWGACETYRCFKDDNVTYNLDGFYADIIDADYPKGDPDAEFPPTRIDRALMAKAFDRIPAGPIEGWHESYRNKFLGMLHAALAGMEGDADWDAYDAQGLVQVGLFGKVIFG